MGDATGGVRPKVVAFDIIETVFAIEPLGGKLVGLGLPAGAFRRLYAEALRDATALAVVDGFAPFLDVMKAALAAMLAEEGLPADDAAMTEALSVMTELPPQPGARDAFSILRDAGVRVFALSNGAAASTRALLDRACLAALVDEILSVESVRLSKPRREVYGHAVAVAGVKPHEVMLVACHPWDVNGALAAGLRGGFVARGKPYPAIMTPPDVVGEDLVDIARRIVAWPEAAG